MNQDVAEINQIKWFVESPDIGLLECICSLCGKVITDPVPVRMFDDTSGREARFDKVCFELVMRKPKLPRILMIYSPSNIPLDWKMETNGWLPVAVKSFINYMVDRSQLPPTSEQVAMIIQYFTHFIFAPCWDESGFAKELLQLRYEIQFVRTIAQLDTWLSKAVGIGLDPL